VHRDAAAGAASRGWSAWSNNDAIPLQQQVADRVIKMREDVALAHARYARILAAAIESITVAGILGNIDLGGPETGSRSSASSMSSMSSSWASRSPKRSAMPWVPSM
jgi:hypothetical protein